MSKESNVNQSQNPSGASSNGGGSAGLGRVQEILEDELTLQSIMQGTTEYFESVCREVFAQKREYFVHRFVQHLSSLEGGVDGSAAKEVSEHEWVGIESLSRLRSVVGGRFQNLKKRWMKAGLPLKEHRGDQNLDYALDEEGWVELTNWILKQGYEARLTDNKTGYLFELRPLGD